MEMSTPKISGLDRLFHYSSDGGSERLHEKLSLYDFWSYGNSYPNPSITCHHHPLAHPNPSLYSFHREITCRFHNLALWINPYFFYLLCYDFPCLWLYACKPFLLLIYLLSVHFSEPQREKGRLLSCLQYHQNMSIVLNCLLSQFVLKLRTLA